MKRKYLVILFGSVGLLSASVVAGSFFDGGWRISVGAAYNAPAKVNLQFSPVVFSGGRVMPAKPSVPDEYLPENAKAKAEGTKDATGKIVYSEDGKTYYKDDQGSGVGGKGSWSISAPMKDWDDQDQTFTLARAKYVDVQNAGGGQGELKLRGEDDSGQFGVLVELSRTLYHNREWDFGVDLAFAFSYFFQTDLYESQRSSARSDAWSVEEGEYVTKTEAADVLEERYIKDGYYRGSGVGTAFYAPTTFREKDPLSSHLIYDSASFYANGNYRDLEMMLTLRPYYDLLDWLRLYGTIGVAVSWSEFDLDVDYALNGTSTRYSRDYQQWDVYGIGGLGLMLRWQDFCLGFDFLARFFDDDLDVHDEIVQGSIRRGRWMFRGYVGYEF